MDPPLAYVKASKSLTTAPEVAVITTSTVPATCCPRATVILVDETFHTDDAATPPKVTD
jgi:hypothetical protein